MDGYRTFVDAVTRFARSSRNPRVADVLARLDRPVAVAVRGRSGVGARTVAAALRRAGVAVGGADTADAEVVVIAEALKPEDRATLRAAARPTLTVLTKADLVGFGAEGALAAARRRAEQCGRLTRTPTVPMVGLLAVADLDDTLVDALRVLVTEPADLTSVDRFVDGAHRLSPAVRRRLLERLDRFGIAHAVLALSEGADAAGLHALLRRLSQVDMVVEQLQLLTAEVGYRRIDRAVVELHCAAVEFEDDELAEFLSGDEAVLAVMAAAVDVVEAAGVRVDRGDDPAAHLHRAVHWRAYARGPVNAVHRGCGAAISRGALRLGFDG